MIRKSGRKLTVWARSLDDCVRSFYFLAMFHALFFCRNFFSDWNRFWKHALLSFLNCAWQRCVFGRKNGQWTNHSIQYCSRYFPSYETAPYLWHKLNLQAWTRDDAKYKICRLLGFITSTWYTRQKRHFSKPVPRQISKYENKLPRAHNTHKSKVVTANKETSYGNGMTRVFTSFEEVDTWCDTLELILGSFLVLSRNMLPRKMQS